MSVSKLLNTGKQAVELRPSRIRREPPGRLAEKELRAYPTTERETWIVVIGVTLFALAIAIIIVGVSNYTSQ